MSLFVMEKFCDFLRPSELITNLEKECTCFVLGQSKFF